MHLKDELDPGFVKLQRAAQRAAWALMLLLILLAGAGVFGTGPLSDEEATAEAEGARAAVKYARWERQDRPTTIAVRVEGAGSNATQLAIAFSREVLAAGSIHASTPPAASGGLGEDGARFVFDVHDWSQPLVVNFEFEPESPWRWEGLVSVSVGNDAPMRLPVRQIAYP